MNATTFFYCMKIFAALLRKDFPETSQRLERRLLSEFILKMKSLNFGVTLYNIRDTDKLQIQIHKYKYKFAHTNTNTNNDKRQTTTINKLWKTTAKDKQQTTKKHK